LKREPDLQGKNAIGEQKRDFFYVQEKRDVEGKEETQHHFQRKKSE